MLLDLLRSFINNSSQPVPTLKMEGPVVINTPKVRINLEEKQKAVMIRYCDTKKGKPVGSNDDYPRYMECEYSISNPPRLQKQLATEGLLYVDDNGNYHPSDTGLELLSKYEWMFYISQYNIIDEEYEAALAQCSHKYKMNDIIWGILNKRILDNAGQYGLIRSDYFSMSNLLLSEKRYANALTMLLAVFWIDLSGWGNSAIQRESNVFAAPAIVKNIAELKEYYNDSMLDGIEAYTPSSYNSVDNFKAIIQKIFNGEDFESLIKRK